MKWIIIALIAAMALFILWPGEPGPKFQTVRAKVVEQGKSIAKSVVTPAKSGEENNELLASKKAELKAFEDALEKVDADIARMQSEVGTCPITGEPNQFILKEDPRPDLRTRIDKLKEEIAQLENSN
jgi:hypothetical protein